MCCCRKKLSPRSSFQKASVLYRSFKATFLGKVIPDQSTTRKIRAEREEREREDRCSIDYSKMRDFKGGMEIRRASEKALTEGK